MKRSIIAVVVALAARFVYTKLQPSADLKLFEEWEIPATRTIPSPKYPTIEFFGTSTLLFEDGESAVMTDAFFSRTGLLHTLVRKLSPQKDMIKTALTRGRVPKHVNAIVVGHSHYDHALDSPEVAKQLGSVLIGSNSTANIALGQNFPKEKLIILPNQVRREMSFGNYKLTAITGKHTPRPISPHDIEDVLPQPAGLFKYALGGVYNVLVNHIPSSKSYLVSASTGFVPGSLHGVEVDVVFLGVATLGKLDSHFQEQYWKEVVLQTKAKTVVPIHYDDFFQAIPEDGTLFTLPAVADDFVATWNFLYRKSQEDNVRLRVLSAYRKVEL
jgi:L-ascorbate metabolism protein UlaG (beta-lactamase superfamily)